MVSEKNVTREILLGFWKVHILHHAEEEPVYGQWIAEELSHHGYRISPGTLYPLLKRMEANGWLKSSPTRAHLRKEYRLTRKGARLLAFLRKQVRELHREVVEEALPAAATSARSSRRKSAPGRAARA